MTRSSKGTRARGSKGAAGSGARRTDRRRAISELHRSNISSGLRFVTRLPYSGSTIAAATPFKDTPPDQWVREFLRSHENMTEDTFFLRHEKVHVMVNATQDELIAHLESYDREPMKAQPRWFRRRGHHVLSSAMRWAPGTFGSMENALSAEAISSLSLNWPAKPGPHYKLKGFATKRAAWDGGAMQETADVVASLLAGTPRIARCAAAGGRAKLTTKEKQSTTRGIGRLVWEMDVVDVAVSSLILAPINAWHQASSNITSLGDTHLYQGGSRLAKYFGYSKDDTSQFGVGTDARKLDSSLREWLTNCIFDHFRSGFSDGWDGKYDTLWSFIKQMHVGGRVHLPGGILFNVPTGMCSGAPFVSIVECYYTEFMHRMALIDCIRSQFRATFYGAATYLRKYLQIKCLGDDNWFTTPGAPFDLESVYRPVILSRSIQHRFGVEIRTDKTYSGRGLSAYYYLSRKLWGSWTSVREPRETLLRWKYAERRVPDVEASYVRAVGLWIDNPIAEVSWILETYLDWLEHCYGVTSSACQWDGLVNHQFAGLGVTVNHRPTYVEVLDLYYGEKP